MLGSRWISFGPFVVVGFIGCAQANTESLRDSFADRISGTEFVSEFSREGNELKFFGPNGQGGISEWKVVIDTSFVEPNEFDDTKTYTGRLTSDWYEDGEIVEYLGTMTALPPEFLDRGLAQECWAFWIEDESRWDW